MKRWSCLGEVMRYDMSFWAVVRFFKEAYGLVSWHCTSVCVRACVSLI